MSDDEASTMRKRASAEPVLIITAVAALTAAALVFFARDELLPDVTWGLLTLSFAASVLGLVRAFALRDAGASHWLAERQPVVAMVWWIVLIVGLAVAIAGIRWFIGHRMDPAEASDIVVHLVFIASLLATTAAFAVPEVREDSDRPDPDLASATRRGLAWITLVATLAATASLAWDRVVDPFIDGRAVDLVELLATLVAIGLVAIVLVAVVVSLRRPTPETTPPLSLPDQPGSAPRIGGTGAAWLAGAASTAGLLPGLVGVSTVGLLLLVFLSDAGGLLHGGGILHMDSVTDDERVQVAIFGPVLGTIAWLVFGFVAGRFSWADRASPAMYEELRSRVDELPRLEDPEAPAPTDDAPLVIETAATLAAREEQLADLRAQDPPDADRIERALIARARAAAANAVAPSAAAAARRSIDRHSLHVRARLGLDGTQPDVGLPWALNSAYVSMWQRIHRAEEAAMMVDPRDVVVGRALRDRARLEGSNVPNKEALLVTSSHALRSLDVSGSLAPVEESQTLTKLDALGAREALKKVRYDLNAFRDNASSSLIGVRRRLTLSLLFAGMTANLILILAILARIDAAVIVVAVSFYLVAAITGLLQRISQDLALEQSRQDYGVSTARLLLAPLVSGIAGVGGVLLVGIVSAAPTGRFLLDPNTPSNLTELFALDSFPFGLVVAAIFGLTPGLLFTRLRTAGEELKTDLSSSE